MNWYKKAQYEDPDPREDMFGDIFKREVSDRTLVKEEEKSKVETITLFRNFDADMSKMQRDSSGNLMLSSGKSEQGAMWFANSLQGNPEQYYKRGAKYLLTLPIQSTYRYTEKTYSNGEKTTWPVSESGEGFDNSSTWNGYTLPEGFKFSYKNEKHIIYEGELNVSPESITEVGADELV